MSDPLRNDPAHALDGACEDSWSTVSDLQPHLLARQSVKLIEARLKAFDVDVTIVRRSEGLGTLRPDQWRSRLGDFDWVILAVPATAETQGMIGRAELAAMKKTAVLLNIARGAVIDQQALTEALTARSIGAAFLDVTEPEPLPADHPLWKMENVILTPHVAGCSPRIAERHLAVLLDNISRFRRGEPLRNVVDKARWF